MRVLIIAPHPDDESLACGGLIQQAIEIGASVRVLFVTDGDNNRWPQRVLERRWFIGPENRAAWGKRRRGEAMAAITLLGLDASHVGFASFPDSGLTDDLLGGRGELLKKLRDEILDFSPTVILSPSIQDHHADHNALAVVVRLAANASPILTEVLEYRIHGPEVADESDERIVRLTPAQIDVKRAAILCHQTQVALSGRRFLAYANEAERFYPAAEDDSPHPVEEMLLDETGWQIQLAPRRWFDRASSAWLEVLACEGSAIVAQRRVMLAGIFGRHRRPAIWDPVANVLIGHGEYRRNGELLLPADFLPPAEQIFVKRQGGIAFFDEAGWKEIFLPEPATAGDDREIPSRREVQLPI